MKFNKNVILASLATLALALGLGFAGDVSAQFNNGLNTQDAANLGLSTQTNIRAVITRVLQTVLGLLALLAVIMIIIGGLIWMTAAGNEDKVETAKKIIYSAVIGLIVILFAYSIVSFVTGTLSNN